MSKKVINIVYICLVFVACACLTIFFFAWNSVSFINNQLQGHPLEHFYVDSCVINKKQIDISGWAFIPNQDHSVTKIYTETNSGKLLPLSSNSMVREDLSNSLSQDKVNRNAGFQASIRFLKKERLTKNIFIVIELKESHSLYVAKYTCQ